MSWLYPPTGIQATMHAQPTRTQTPAETPNTWAHAGTITLHKPGTNVPTLLDRLVQGRTLVQGLDPLLDMLVQGCREGSRGCRGVPSGDYMLRAALEVTHFFLGENRHAPTMINVLVLL